MVVCKFMLDELKFVVSLIVLLSVLCLCLKWFCVTFSGVYFNESCIIVYCKQFLERCVLIQCVLDIVKSLYYSVRSNHLYSLVRIKVLLFLSLSLSLCSLPLYIYLYYYLTYLTSPV